LIYFQYGGGMAAPLRLVVGNTLWTFFLTFLVLSGIAAWLLVLAHESGELRNGSPSVRR